MARDAAFGDALGSSLRRVIMMTRRTRRASEEERAAAAAGEGAEATAEPPFRASVAASSRIAPPQPRSPLFRSALPPPRHSKPTKSNLLSARRPCAEQSMVAPARNARVRSSRACS